MTRDEIRSGKFGRPKSAQSAIPAEFVDLVTNLRNDPELDWCGVGDRIAMKQWDTPSVYSIWIGHGRLLEDVFTEDGEVLE